MAAIPTSETLDAAWLTERLREGGHERAVVEGFEATRIGTGQIGKCLRLALRVGGDAAAPRSLVAKFASDDPASRQTGVQLRNFLKEVSFYRDLQSRVSISTPRCYFAEIEGEGPNFLLLLEDLAPAHQGDQLAGCDETVAAAALAELAGLHAPTWCDEKLTALDWLGMPTGEHVQLLRALYSLQLPGFLDRYRDRLASDEARILALVAETDGPLFQVPGRPFAAVHVDYRLDNLLIDDRRRPPRVFAVDWQTVTLGRPLSDVAYFLGSGLVPERRREAEENLVGGYHAALAEAGVGGYAWEDCWQDYRRGVFAGFAVTVIAAMIVERTARGDEMFLAMARRHSRHALDLGGEALLRGRD